jgi:mannose-6-phosphate isomerase-like protein (cupin superfamily)
LAEGYKSAVFATGSGLYNLLDEENSDSTAYWVSTSGAIALREKHSGPRPWNKNLIVSSGDQVESWGMTEQASALRFAKESESMTLVGDDLIVIEPKEENTAVVPTLVKGNDVMCYRFVGKIETSTPNIRLGDHEHRDPNHIEVFVIAEGECDLLSGKNDGSGLKKTHLKTGNVVIIPPGIGHTFKSDGNFTLLPLSTVKFDPKNNDIFGRPDMKSTDF